jgi:hypothetical protein
VSSFVQSAAQETKKPDRIVVIPPSLFAATYRNRPTAEVAIGLRVISERDVQIGRAAASKHMVTLYGTDTGKIRDPEQAYGCWNDTWLAYAIGKAACDPNDADKPYFTFAEEEVARALSSEGLRRLWDEYCLINRGTGERAQIADEELLPLAKSLVNVGFLEPVQQAEIRKHLAWVLEILEGSGLRASDTEDEETDEDESVYVVTTVETAAASSQ